MGHPFFWDGAKLIDLVTPPFEASLGGEARRINEAGEVVGSAGLVIPGEGPQTHGFLWRNGAMTDLGIIPGFQCSQADFINSNSQVVGGSFSCDNGSSLASLWQSGSMVDLNSLISANAPVYLYWATYIDDQGVIGAVGSLANVDSHVLLLMPCDENHANIEGCDYSPVDAVAVPQQAHERNPCARNEMAALWSEWTLMPFLIHGWHLNGGQGRNRTTDTRIFRLVFLHAGTRNGAKRLGLDGSRKMLAMRDLPSAFRVLEPREIEDALCIYKAELGSAAFGGGSSRLIAAGAKRLTMPSVSG